MEFISAMLYDAILLLVYTFLYIRVLPGVCAFKKQSLGTEISNWIKLTELWIFIFILLNVPILDFF